MAAISKYQEAYDNFVNPPKTDNEKSTACEKLQEFRMLAIFLRQEKDAFLRKVFLSDYPCMFFKHHPEIDELTERLQPIGHKLERECLIETHDKLVAKAAKATKAAEEAMRCALKITV